MRSSRLRRVECCEMDESFEHDIMKTFEAASKHRDVIEKIRQSAGRNPIRLALIIINRLPDHLAAARVARRKAWGVDLDDEA